MKFLPTGMERDSDQASGKGGKNLMRSVFDKIRTCQSHDKQHKKAWWFQKWLLILYIIFVLWYIIWGRKERISIHLIAEWHMKSCILLPDTKLLNICKTISQTKFIQWTPKSSCVFSPAQVCIWNKDRFHSLPSHKSIWEANNVFLR